MSPRTHSQTVLLSMLAALPACGIAEKNFQLSVKADGSADVSMLLFDVAEIDASLRTSFNPDSKFPCVTGDDVAPRFGLSGVHDASCTPLRIDYVSARATDVDQLRIDDITARHTIVDDRMTVTLKIPIGPNARWMKRFPIVDQRVSAEVREQMRLAPNSFIGADNADFGGNNANRWNGWSFQIDVPGDIDSAGVDCADSASDAYFMIKPTPVSMQTWAEPNDKKSAVLFIRAEAIAAARDDTLSFSVAGSVHPAAPLSQLGRSWNR